MVSELQTALRTQIHKFLELSLYTNAIFLAERLVAEEPSESNLFLLSTCYYRCKKYNRAISILQSCQSEENRYLKALCYLETNKLLDARNVLLDGTQVLERGPQAYRHQLVGKDATIPKGAAGLYLLGIISQKDQCREHAIEYYTLCLQSDPFYWDAYKALCDLGAKLKPQTFFGADTYFNTLETTSMPQFETPLSKENMQTPIGSQFLTPSDGNAIRIRTRRSARHLPTDSSNSKQLRRSGRLSFSSDVFTPPQSSKSDVNDELLPTETPDPGKTRSNEGGKEALLILLCSLGLGYYHLQQYQCSEALRVFQSLPHKHLETGWVQQHIGRVYFEMCKYEEAKTVFEHMRTIAPHQMEGLERYSNVLWHLQKDTELCFLAQEISNFEKLSCEVWCVVGNCFSRQKEHETALKFFKRAIQLDASFTYAHTLCGHEYVSNEDFEKATTCYRQAIALDPRHYNAWYGLGTIYYRQEKFHLAEYHFRRALEINSRSSLLYCYLGMVLLSCQKHEEALSMLSKATELQPANPQARFQKANVLIEQSKYKEALEELQEVRNFAPKESSVHFLMGKVCKRMGLTNEAMHHFSNALYFNPKDNNVIKMAIDRLNDPDEDEENQI